MAVAGLLEIRQKGLGSVYHPPEVNIHKPFEVFIAHGIDGFSESNAGIVHYQVNLSVLLDTLIRIPIDLIPSAYINNMGGDSDRVVAQVDGDVF